MSEMPDVQECRICSVLEQDLEKAIQYQRSNIASDWLNNIRNGYTLIQRFKMDVLYRALKNYGIKGLGPTGLAEIAVVIVLHMETTQGDNEHE